MPAYHSSFLDFHDTRTVGNFALLPLKTRFKGPAYPLSNPQDPDIIDECIELFRANCFFRNFEIRGPADRTLIYGILFISDCLQRLSSRTPPTQSEAVKSLNSLALEQFTIPGEPGFPMNGMFAPPAGRSEGELLKGYLGQFRQELGQRLILKVYEGGEGGAPSKWWMAFSKKRFMNKSL
ncbi:arp2/3 complex subunit [Saitoella complicata NRRL Y-17804]|uniref:arp2/3 complex subunit n=1 Tax=Saitoella complicata (strain BCRC 22490 / CBS 7301 / JCM 7358 / NBRC 10748 / NRRL Y-17804) TaxID=698492 RepID=UPI000867E7DA|nr:arp2/3 complex subunit [Saitoella complicata NRRL Y-17804]ODQ51008.1 arp2/3 complex subunit [Saitoella complicata NRRL Y-17804]